MATAMGRFGAYTSIALANTLSACWLAFWSTGCTTSHPSEWAADASTDDDLAVQDADAGTDSGADASADADAAPPAAYLRVAHASSDLAAIDLCVALHGSGKAQGPLLSQLAAAIAADAGIDAGAGGLSFGNVSAYLTVPPGQYDLTWVPAGSASCKTALAPEDGGSIPRATTTPALALANGDYATVLVAGDSVPVGKDKGIAVSVLRDDPSLAGGGAALRAIDAVPSVSAIDIGLGSSTSWLPLLVDVSFGTASGHAAPGETAPDSHGYVPIDPSAATGLVVRPAGVDGGAAMVTAENVAIDLGSLVTVFSMGGKTGDSAHPPFLLLCIDNAPSGTTLGNCSVP